MMTGEKRVVVADGLMYGLMRAFNVYQSEHSRELVIVRTLAKAYDELGVKADDFRPIALT